MVQQQHWCGRDPRGEEGQHGSHPWRPSCLSIPTTYLWGICIDINSLAWTLSRTVSKQTLNFVSKILQNKCVYIDIAIMHVRQLLEFFKEFRISDYENFHNIAKQLPTDLEIETKFKRMSHSKEHYFCMKLWMKQLLTSKIILKLIFPLNWRDNDRMHKHVFELYTNHEVIFSFL